MAMKLLREGAASGILKFFLMGLLLLAVGGLVLTDVGGFFRGGVGRTDVAKIGHEKINIHRFDRSVQRDLQRIGMSPQEAYEHGQIQQILLSEIRRRLMVQSASNLGVEVSKERLAENVAKLIRPLVREDQSAQDVLNNILLTRGMSEAEFVSTMQSESSSNMLTAALASGFATLPPGLAKDLYLFQNEERDIELIVFPNESAENVKEPTDEQLSTLYASLKETYAIPERRTLMLGILDTDNLQQNVEISDEELRREYDAIIDSFYVSEQRKLEQAILKSDLEARDVIKRVQDGEAMKAAVEAVTGDSNAYLGEQTYEENGLLDEIKSEAFSGEPRLIEEPIQTALGWHVIKVEEVLEPYTKSFDDVKDRLKEEMLQTRLADQLYDTAGAIDDLLAGGALFDEVVKELHLKTEKLSDIDTFGLDKDQNDSLGNFSADRQAILETGFQLFEGESSPVIELQGGNFMTIHVQSIKEKSYPPFEEVKPQLLEKWTADQRRVENNIKVANLVNFLNSDSSATLESVAKGENKEIITLDNVKRTGAPPEPLNNFALSLIFPVELGKYTAIDTSKGAAIAYVKNVDFPEEINETQLLALETNLAAGIQNEALTSFILSKENAAKVMINQKLLEQIYGPSREDFLASGGLSQ